MKNQISNLIIAALLVGCSSGGSDDKNAQPQDKVNSKITGHASGALSGQAGVFEASQSRSQKNSNLTRVMNHKFLFAAQLQSPNSNSESQTATQEKAQRLNQSISSSACQVDLMPGAAPSGPVGGAAAEFKPMKLKISGLGCPVEINFETTMIGVGGNPCQKTQGVLSCQFRINAKMSYRVLDDKLSQELETSSGHFNMSFDIDQTLPDGSAAQASMNMIMKGKSSIDIKAVDLQEKVHMISGSSDANITMLMPTGPGPGPQPMPQMSGSMKEELNYLQEASGISSALSASITFSGSSPDEKYFVDGVSVTATAYANERDKFANSMMAFGTQDGDQNNSPGNSQPLPNPNNPNPFPNPNPGPGPIPNPEPSDRRWACIVDSYSPVQVFIGYGSVEFVARSKAKQACQATGVSCSSNIFCEEQAANPKAWYCETKSYSHNLTFGGEGASKIEASYFARRACYGSTNATCSSISDSSCAQQ